MGKSDSPRPIRGYIEGYYGRLLSWAERGMVLDALARYGMHGFLYAPKEDPAHRRLWRGDWDGEWWQGFAAFTRMAQERGIRVMAGIAPGADFDFASLENDGEGDAAILLAKARRLHKAGADSISILFDDIDPAPATRLGGLDTEGAAHAAAANMLAEHMDCAISLTPRIYADEITDSADGYINALAGDISAGIKIFTCGSHIVAPAINPTALAPIRAGIPQTDCIIWDNFYANDYCPRRLFLGRYRGREGAGNIMLNPTGLPHTDCLLLALMAAGDDDAKWREAIKAHGVPDAFFAIAAFFDAPPDPRKPATEAGVAFNPHDAKPMLAALDTLLWEWQTPLAREWYPYMMGLRGDILYRSGKTDTIRRAKIFPPLLFDPED